VPISGIRGRRRLFQCLVLTTQQAAVGVGSAAELLGESEGDRSEVLLLMQQHFGCGTIRPDRSDRTLKFEVRRLDHLVERIIPFFEVNRLLSSKHRDFERFAAICRLVQASAHRTRAGLREIVDLATAMNPSGKRRYAAATMFPEELKL